MPSDLKAALQTLKAALLGLRPTGENGFEGLLAEILNEITKHDFRLASSGLQLGVDGETLTGADHLSFEGKLYTGSINKNEVLTKITSIIASPSPPVTLQLIVRMRRFAGGAAAYLRIISAEIIEYAAIMIMVRAAQRAWPRRWR